MRTSAEIRREFIDFFVKKHGHAFVPSSPVVPLDDPTLMFTNAGMNQFKPLFLGQADPNSEFGRMKRAANTQKCIRAGGKHNDLDDVGHDTYHHTFFEMLGNWSFGDYFKKEAIAWAWELLTQVWGLDKRRLHATVFEGSPDEGVPRDDEAFDLWKTVTDIDPTHIHFGNKKDNFWEMGDTGPCGPCSEIHIDLTEDASGGPLVNAGDARVMEIWNLVFIQFNRGADGKLTPLPARHVDTGMGFERITAVVQGKRSNYDTDVFSPLFGVIQRITGAAGYTGLLENQSDDRAAVMKDVAYRVIADHIRTLTFAITDGAEPSNEGRGYVLRRILRRAFRYGWQYLGAKKPFLHKLVPAVVDLMDEAFPELRKRTRHVADVVLAEEESFSRTLERGISLFDEAAQYAVTHHHGRIKGEHAFKLHDTYGFPIDLTQLMAEEKGLTVDVAEYERLMEEAREKARGAGTDDGHFQFVFGRYFGPTKFNPDAREVLEDIASVDVFNEQLNDNAALSPGQRGYIVLGETGFYAEQGGQVGDTGAIEHHGGDWRFVVDDTTKANATIVHHGYADPQNRKQVVGSGNPNAMAPVGPSGPLPKPHSAWAHRVRTRVDWARRQIIMANHTSTHLLNWALREVLGKEIEQKGSLVDPDKTRFDFSYRAALSDEQLRRVQDLVNAGIAKDWKVYTDPRVPIAKKPLLDKAGLRAVFEGAYPAEVRVVSIGVPVEQLLARPDNAEWWQHSIEFCGGTHLKNTKEAGRFLLVEESAVARGIRRVVGITGEAAARAERDADALAAELDAALRGGKEPRASARAADDVAGAVTTLARRLETALLPVLARARLRDALAELQEMAKKHQKEQSKHDTAGVLDRAARLLDAAERIGGAAVIVGEMGSATAEQLRPAMDSLRARAGSAAILLASEAEGKVVLLAAMTADVVQRGVKAGDLIKEIAALVGGRGGGKPDMAQGGGPDLAKLPAALSAAREWLSGKLGG